MMFVAPTKGRKLRIVITHSIVLANQKTESLVYRLLDVTWFPTSFCWTIGHDFKQSVDMLISER